MEKESEKLYTSIVDGGYDSRLIRSLKNIKKACDQIQSYGGRIYVGRVGKLCRKELGGPTAQSIRNQPETLKRYIDLRAAEQLLPDGVREKDKELKISDPKIRAYVLILEERLRDTEELVRMLKKLLGRIAPVEIDKLISEAFGGKIPLELPAAPNESADNDGAGRLSEPARRALEKMTGEAHLKKFGLSLYKGRVLNAASLKFLDKDEYQALLDLLAA